MYARLTTILALVLLPALCRGQDAALQRRDLSVPSLLDLESPTRASATSSARPTGRPGRETTPADLYGEQEILVRADQGAEPWTLSLSSGYDYHSNASQSPTTETEDYLSITALSLGGSFKLSESLYYTATLTQQFARYAELDLLDFDRTDFTTGLSQVLPASWPVLGNSIASLGVKYSRLTSAGSFNDELLSDLSLSASLLRSFTLTERQALIAGLSALVSVDTDSPSAQRDEYSLLGVWQSKWTAKWETSLAVIGAFHDYQAHDDLFLVTAASLSYNVTEWFKLGLSASYITNDSNQSAFDYTDYGGGVNLRASLKF